MYIFLPNNKDGLLNLLGQFSSNPDLLNLNFKFRSVELRKMMIPKFKFKYGFDVSDIMEFKYGFEVSHIMEPLGLKLNLKDSEILEGLDGDIAMENSKISHKCCIEVNEIVELKPQPSPLMKKMRHVLLISLSRV